MIPTSLRVVAPQNPLALTERSTLVMRQHIAPTMWSIALVGTALFAAPPLREAGSASQLSGVVRSQPASYLLGAPLFSILDAMTVMARFASWIPTTSLSTFTATPRLRTMDVLASTRSVTVSGTPRRLPLGGEQVIHFRTLQDYRRLRALADQGETFAVIGGGFIGSEIAAALAMQGCSVTMVFPEDGIGARVFPADLARALVGYYREKGVDARPGERVTAMNEQGSQVVVETASGFRVTVDAVVAGIGIMPNTELAERAGLAVDDGIGVNEHLTTTHPDVFAAGDVARVSAPQLGKRIRVEHEDNALNMGRAAGRAMAGDRTPYAHLPFFYSDLFERGYEAVGEMDPRGETVADWKQDFLEGVVYYLSGGRVRGVLLWNTWGQVDAARELIAQPGPFAAADLKGRLVSA